jgi:hypothetical protein
MYTHTDTAAPPSWSPAAMPTRAALQTRPAIQRALIRSWEYSRPVRLTVLAIRLLAVPFLLFVTAILLSKGIMWGWILPPAAVGVLALSAWVFNTAAKGWPVR